MHELLPLDITHAIVMDVGDVIVFDDILVDIVGRSVGGRSARARPTAAFKIWKNKVFFYQL